jgi:hypothetical protein
LTEQSRGYHVLTKSGDASGEVEEAARELGSVQSSGLHRHFFVARARQTVVMANAPDAPIVRLLLKREGWKEPARQEYE